MRNLITDVPGVLVGNAQDMRAATGATVGPRPSGFCSVAQAGTLTAQRRSAKLRVAGAAGLFVAGFTVVFVLATANRFDVLPEPMLRKGRFDELWWVDLPNRAEREAIFRIHLRKRNRTMDDPFIRKWTAMTDGFIGSEIEQVVIAGLLRAFDAGRQLTPADIYAGIAETVPLTKTIGEKLAADRQKAKGKLRPASTPDVADRQDGERVVEVG